MPTDGGTDSGREPTGIDDRTGFKLGGAGGAPDGTCDWRNDWVPKGAF
jgi:hypothetical protein